MAIVDSPAFALSDVISELGLPTASSLSDCFANADPNQFDSEYSGSKDRLSNFRNYGAACDFPTDLVLGFGSTTALACGFSNAALMKVDGTNLTNSTAIKTSSCVFAAVGYYSEGNNVRYWNGSTLGPVLGCASSSASMQISLVGRSLSGTACGDTPNTTKYNNGGSPEPTVGDYIYNNSSLTTPFNGGGLWYAYDNSFGAIKIDTTGEVLDKVLCFAP